MLKVTRSGCVVGFALLAACGSGAAPPAENAPPARQVAIESTPPSSAAGPTPAAPCVMPEKVQRCVLPAVEQEALDARVQTLLKKVKDSAWKDHASLIELTRSQLLASRAYDDADIDGPGLNAKRALAVKPTSEARLVAALTMLHTHLPRTETLAARQLLFTLVEQMLDVDATTASPAVEQARALVGYHRLIGHGAPRGLLDRTSEIPLGNFAAQVRDDWHEGHRSDARLATYPPLTMAMRESEIPAPWGAPFAMPTGTLASAAPPITKCDGAATQTPEGKTFCAAALALEASPSLATATAVLDAYGDLRPACDAKEPVCGGHVAETLVATGAAFAEAGLMAKAIAVLRITENKFPSQAPDVGLRISDSYYALGVFDLASRWAVTYARGQGWKAPAALRRALGIDLALGKSPIHSDWLGLALRSRALPVGERRAWAELAARTIPAPDRPAWVKTLPPDVRPAQEAAPHPSAPACDATLLCGYVAVINDPSWSSLD